MSYKKFLSANAWIFSSSPLVNNYKKVLYALDSNSIIAITDPRGVIQYANQKFCEISGYSEDELLGAKHSLVNSGYHTKTFWAEMWRTIASGRTWERDVCNRKKSGELYWVHTTIVPLFNDEGRVSQYIAIRQDITARKRAEEELEHHRLQAISSEKMATLGQMAAGISHELGNPLGALRGRIEMLEMQAQQREGLAREQVTAFVNQAHGLIDRMSMIIRGMRSYARNSSGDPMAPASLKSLVQDVIEFSMHRMRSEAIELELHGLEKSDYYVLCRESEIGQVILNLVSNACDAIKEQAEDRRKIQVEVSETSQACHVSVTDTGPGLTPDAERKMFSPFFTTKPVGQGTGLGLSISQRIVEAHGGRLNYSRDKEKQETRFTLTLPRDH